MISRRLGLCGLVLLSLGGLGCAAAPASKEPTGAAAPASPPPPMAASEDESSAGSEPAAPRAASVNETLGGGTLTQQEIRAEVVKHVELFDQCYLIGAGKSRDFVATVTVKATLGPSGSVTASEVIKSTAKNKKVDACVAEAFKKIKFPAPKGAATSVITFPMEFEATEEVRQ